MVANAPRRPTNQAGINIIKQFEGLRLKAYLCPAGIWTIGYGHTRTVWSGMEITEAQAEDLLREDIRFAETAIGNLVTVRLGENQFSALASFVFNIGIGNFQTSTLLKLLNRGWYEQVPAQLMRWNKVNGEEMGGLSRRRAAEAALWNQSEFVA